MHAKSNYANAWATIRQVAADGAIEIDRILMRAALAAVDSSPLARPRPQPYHPSRLAHSPAPPARRGLGLFRQLHDRAVFRLRRLGQ